MEEIRRLFAEIEDPRHKSYVEHELCNILILVMGAVICGVTELIDMMVYFENTSEFYKEKFGIESIPSKSTISRVLSTINPNIVGAVIIDVMRQHTQQIGDILAVDGKAICGTSEKGKPHSFLQILSVYATESGLTIAQSSIHSEDKTNEIPVVQNLLESLNIEGKTITADAMHCQKETCRLIKAGKGDYVFGIKGNQHNFYEDIKLFLDDPAHYKDMPSFETIETNGGRIEKRTIRVSNEVSWIPNRQKWDGLNSIFSITRTVATAGGTTVDTGYYISSLEANPERLLYVSRSHWMIESMHWSLDVVFNEDNNGFYSNNTQMVLNIFRKLALFAHKAHVAQQPVKNRRSVKKNVFHALLNNDACFQVISLLSNSTDF